MPGQLKDRLPNRALSGAELRTISTIELDKMLAKDPAFSANIGYRQAAFSIEANYTLPFPHQPQTVTSHIGRSVLPQGLTGEVLGAYAVEQLRLMLTRHYIFTAGSMAFHQSSFTLRATFHLGEQYQPKDGVAPECLITGEAPLPPEFREGAVVVSLERDVKLENPNIDRINHGMPIVLQRATPPKAVVNETLPHEPPTAVMGAPEIENLEFRYDAAQFPAPAEPVDRDVSEAAAARLGVPQRAE